MRIGILGSTCNPPHKRHIAIGSKAKKILKLERIIFIPVKDPPHKDKIRVPAELRFEMARRAVGKRRGWEISDIELKRPGKSYTADTIADLKKIYPHDELFWIVGADSLVSMPWKWKGGFDVLDLCQFVVAPRKGYDLALVSEDILKKVIILPISSQSISSTEIREKIGQEKDVDKFVDPSVLEFIKLNNLYAAL